MAACGPPGAVVAEPGSSAGVRRCASQAMFSSAMRARMKASCSARGATRRCRDCDTSLPSGGSSRQCTQMWVLDSAAAASGTASNTIGSAATLGAGPSCSSCQAVLASPQLRPNLISARIGTASLTASQASRAMQLTLFRGGDRAFQPVVHLQQRDDRLRASTRASTTWCDVAAEPWISAFSAVWILARPSRLRNQGVPGIADALRCASSSEHGRRL